MTDLLPLLLLSSPINKKYFQGKTKSRNFREKNHLATLIKEKPKILHMMYQMAKYVATSKQSY